MKKIFIVLAMFMFSIAPLFAAGSRAENAASLSIEATAPAATEVAAPDLEARMKEAAAQAEAKKLSWKQKAALKFAQKKIEKIKSPADEVVEILRIIGIVLIVAGAVGLLLSVLGLGYIGFGASALVLGIILYLVAKVI